MQIILTIKVRNLGGKYCIIQFKNRTAISWINWLFKYSINSRTVLQLLINDSHFTFVIKCITFTASFQYFMIFLEIEITSFKGSKVTGPFYKRFIVVWVEELSLFLTQFSWLQTAALNSFQLWVLEAGAKTTRSLLLGPMYLCLPG